MLQDLMSEAMEETDGQHPINLQQNGEDLEKLSGFGLISGEVSLTWI